MEAKKIYWHLPGFCVFRQLNYCLISLMKEFPNRFREGYRVGSVYGSFPGAIWNGGRAVFGITGKTDMQKIIKAFNSLDVPVRFTWTNCLIEEKHLQDTYCNLIMRLADNGLNQVLVNSAVLENYIRSEYPSYPVISSTTKRIVTAGGLKEELERDYFLVVLDYDLNHDEAALTAAQPMASRVEILVNEVCYPGCKMRTEHYKQQSRLQLEFDVNTPFPCPNNSRPRSFAECMTRPAFISNDEIGSYIDRGFVNFKIAGRGMPQDYVEDAYIYFLVRDEYRDEIRERLAKKLRQFAPGASAAAPVRRRV